MPKPPSLSPSTSSNTLPQFGDALAIACLIWSLYVVDQSCRQQHLVQFREHQSEQVKNKYQIKPNKQMKLDNQNINKTDKNKTKQKNWITKSKPNQTIRTHKPKLKSNEK
jgi:hypothetical protein